MIEAIVANGTAQSIEYPNESNDAIEGVVKSELPRKHK